MQNSAISHQVFREAVEAIDAGDVAVPDRFKHISNFPL
jgi:hypothetical protein